MVGSVRLNTAALWTLEYHLTLLKAHALNVFFGCVTPEIIIVAQILCGKVMTKLSLAFIL